MNEQCKAGLISTSAWGYGKEENVLLFSSNSCHHSALNTLIQSDNDWSIFPTIYSISLGWRTTVWLICQTITITFHFGTTINNIKVERYFLWYDIALLLFYERSTKQSDKLNSSRERADGCRIVLACAAYTTAVLFGRLSSLFMSFVALFPIQCSDSQRNS